MSSRVQKGNTVFRPVVNARSRAPTANPAPTSLPPSSLSAVPDPIPAVPPPIPSTAVPGREALKQVVPTQQQDLVSLPSQYSRNVVQEPSTLVRGMSIPPPLVSHSTSVLTASSNLSPLIPLGRSQMEQANLISVPSRQETRPPVIVSHSSQIPNPAVSIILPGPSRQSTVISPPSGSPPAEVTNTLIATPTHDDSHYASASQPIPRKKRDDGEKPRRRQKLPNTNSDGETEGPSAKKPKSRSITPRRRRSRGPSLPPYDPHADPGEDIDPTVVTMATLCSDIGQGRVSSKAAEILNNHAAWKVKNRERRARMRVMMEAKKYGRQVDDDGDRPEDQTNNTLSEAENKSNHTASSSAGPSTAVGDDESGFDYTQHMEPSKYNVQVRIGPSGETIIDEDSLVVDRAENEDMSNYTHVVESDHTKFVNSGTYGKRYRGSRWSTEETELFYHALSQYGENYELIAYVLPGRDRKSCKNKFKAEDKKNHARINECLNKRIPVDMRTLERMTGKDFSGPVPEIRAPPPPPMIQSGPRENTEDTNPRSAPTKPGKRRSRSRTSGLEDGVTIIGEIDGVLS